tara:strand:- start:296 stop:1102 length:807 start_codon:yes stop_codon:yes gene_type:complete
MEGVAPANDRGFTVTASLREIKVYTTFPHDCSYLADMQATTLFVDPRQAISVPLYTQLSLLGFRRSGDHIYRPHCISCSACIASRVPVNTFQASRSQRRVWRRNQDLRVIESGSIIDDEAYGLYARYINLRHSDGDMYPPDRQQYESFLNGLFDCTRYLRFYEDDRLLCVAVIDVMLDGLSAIYTFYDPDEERRSLGTFAILAQIEHAARHGLDYLYLGYWIEQCNKMNYKARFQPLELFTDGRWQSLDQPASVELMSADVISITDIT